MNALWFLSESLHMENAWLVQLPGAIIYSFGAEEIVVCLYKRVKEVKRWSF